MGLYRQIPGVVHATQWFKPGDHKKVVEFGGARLLPPCEKCGRVLSSHGWIRASIPQGGYRVCPGDWIIADSKGGHRPCKPEIFVAIYEATSLDEAGDAKGVVGTWQ